MTYFNGMFGSTVDYGFFTREVLRQTGSEVLYSETAGTAIYETRVLYNKPYVRYRLKATVKIFAQ